MPVLSPKDKGVEVPSFSDVMGLLNPKDSKELERRERLAAEREAEYDLVGAGLVLFCIKNRTTGELRYKTAPSQDDALKALGWDARDCRSVPVYCGKEKVPMPEEVKQVLREKAAAQRAEKNADKPVKEKGPSLKSEMEAVFREFPNGTKEELTPKLFEILKRRNPDKDDAHLNKRANLCYYFYKNGGKE